MTWGEFFTAFWQTELVSWDSVVGLIVIAFVYRLVAGSGR